MNLGLHIDLRNPAAWGQDPARVHAFTLELIEEAERLGIHSVWLSEHHRFDDGYLTQPLVFAAAVAARTERIRIGTAVLLAPFRHPAHIAEEAALVDLISGGRFELGLGAGYHRPEFDLFDVDVADRYRLTDDAVVAIRHAWGGQTPPLPAQDPVPIWLGYGGPKGAARAGRLGTGLLSIDSRLIQPYREGLEAGGHDESTGRMAGPVTAFVTEDPERDWPVVARHLEHQWNTYRHAMVAGTGGGPPPPIDPERWRHPSGGRPARFGYGTPDDVAAHIREAVGTAPVETVFLWASIAGMDEARASDHVRLLADGLAPLLSDG